MTFAGNSDSSITGHNMPYYGGQREDFIHCSGAANIYYGKIILKTLY